MNQGSAIVPCKYKLECKAISTRGITLKEYKKTYVTFKVISKGNPSLNENHKSSTVKTNPPVYHYQIERDFVNIDNMGIDIIIYNMHGGMLSKQWVMLGSTGVFNCVNLLLQPVRDLWFPLYDMNRKPVGEILLNLQVTELRASVHPDEYQRITAMHPGTFGTKIISMELDPQRGLLKSNDFETVSNNMSDWCNNYAHMVDIVSTSLNGIPAVHPGKHSIIANITYRRKQDAAHQVQQQPQNQNPLQYHQPQLMSFDEYTNNTTATMASDSSGDFSPLMHASSPNIPLPERPVGHSTSFSSGGINYGV